MASTALDWGGQQPHAESGNAWTKLTNTVLQTPALHIQLGRDTSMGFMPITTGVLRVQWTFAGAENTDKYRHTQIVPLGANCVLPAQQLVVNAKEPHLGAFIAFDTKGNVPEPVTKLGAEAFTSDHFVEMALFPLQAGDFFKSDVYNSKQLLSNSNINLTLKITCSDSTITPYTRQVIDQITNMQVDLEQTSLLWNTCNQIRNTQILSMMSTESQQILQMMPMQLPNAHSPLQTNNSPPQIDLLLGTLSEHMPEYWLHPMLTTMVQYMPMWESSGKPKDVMCAEMEKALNYNMAAKNVYTFDTGFAAGIELKPASNDSKTLLAKFGFIANKVGEQHQTYGLSTKTQVETNIAHVQNLRAAGRSRVEGATAKTNIGITIATGVEKPSDCEDGAYEGMLVLNAAKQYSKQRQQTGNSSALTTHLHAALCTGLYGQPAIDKIPILADMIESMGFHAGQKKYTFACGLAAAPNMQTPAASFQIPSGLSAQKATESFVRSLQSNALGGHAYFVSKLNNKTISQFNVKFDGKIVQELQALISKSNLPPLSQVQTSMDFDLDTHEKILVHECTSPVKDVMIDDQNNKSLLQRVSFSLSMQLNSGKTKPVTSIQNVTQTRIAADTLVPAYQANFIETNYGCAAVGIPLNKVPTERVDNWSPTFVQSHFALDGIPLSCNSDVSSTLTGQEWLMQASPLPSEKGVVEGTVTMGTLVPHTWPVEKQICTLLAKTFIPGAFPGLPEQTQYLSTIACQLTPPEEWRTELPMFADYGLVKVRRLSAVGSCEKEELKLQQKLAADVGAIRLCDDTVLSFTLGFPRTSIV